MKAIPKVLFFLLVLLIAVVITGLFLPSELKVSGSKELEAKSSIIYPLINDLNNWAKWSPLVQRDTVSTVIYTNKNESGRSMNWEDAVYGESKAVIVHGKQDESVAANFYFGDDSQLTMIWFMESLEKTTLVNWTIGLTDLSLWEKYFALFYRSKIKYIIDEGLKGLTSCSNTYSYSRIGEISIDSLKAQPTVIMVDSVSEKNSKPRLKEMEDYLQRFLSRRELTAVDSAFTIRYKTESDTLFKVAKGFPLAERTWVWKTLEYYGMPEGRVVSVSHYGSTPPLKAYKAIEDYIQSNKLNKIGHAWEVDLYNPELDTDSTLWETKIYYPVN